MTCGEVAGISPAGPMHGPTGLTISVKLDGEHVGVAMRGELDIATAPQLEFVLKACLARTTSGIDVDLSEVAFIDAAGLGLLVTADNDLGREGRHLRIRHPSSMCETLLHITGLEILAGASPKVDSEHVSPIRRLDGSSKVAGIHIDGPSAEFVPALPFDRTAGGAELPKVRPSDHHERLRPMAETGTRLVRSRRHDSLSRRVVRRLQARPQRRG